MVGSLAVEMKGNGGNRGNRGGQGRGGPQSFTQAQGYPGGQYQGQQGQPKQGFVQPGMSPMGGGYQHPPVQGFSGPMPGKGSGQGRKGHASVAPMGAQQVSSARSLA